MAETEKTYGTLVTNTGTRLIAEAALNGKKINIVHFAVGDGGGAYYQPTEVMTELKREVWRGAVGSAKISETSPNMIDVVTVVPSNVGGFTIREMAVFDEENNLIAICNTADAEKVVISSGEVAEMKLTMHITVSNKGGARNGGCLRYPYHQGQKDHGAGAGASESGRCGHSGRL